MDKDLESTLDYLYSTTGLGSAYGSINQLWKTTKHFHPKVRKQQIKKWLSSKDAYTLHKLPRKKNQPKVLVRGIDDQWSADLCDMKNIAKHNNNTNFMLTVIDVFSKKADAEPVVNKTGKAVAEAFNRILERAYPRSPRLLETDHGKEFYNTCFTSVCEENNIHLFSTQSAYKASTVERFNRTLKNLLYRYFTDKNTYSWLKILPKIIDTYNNRHHRSIKMKPNEVCDDNETIVRMNLYGKKTRRKEKLFSIGTLVRISKTKRTFHKAYLPTFTEEIFKVYETLTNYKPYRYRLEDLFGEKLEGAFCGDEIQEVIKGDDMWKIDKVISRRKTKTGIQYLVSWRGFPEKFNSYVKERDIVSLS